MDITIKNFKIFDDNGVKLTLSPITFLTGENSSGKSSVTKALLLLQNYFSKAEVYQKLPFENLDFSKYNLPEFDNIINYSSSNNKITYVTKLSSGLLHKDFYVEYIFEKKEGDDLNNAWLNKISVWDVVSNDRIYYWSIDDCKQYINALFFKENFFSSVKDLLQNKKNKYNYRIFKNINNKLKHQLENCLKLNIIFYFDVLNEYSNNDWINKLIDYKNYSCILDFISNNQQIGFVDYYIKQENDILLNFEINDEDRFGNSFTFELKDNIVSVVGSINNNSVTKINSSKFFNRSLISSYFQNFLDVFFQELLIPETLSKDIYFIGTEDIHSDSIKHIMQNYSNSKLISNNNKKYDKLLNALSVDINYTAFWLKKLNIADDIKIEKQKIYLVKNGIIKPLSNEGLGIIKLVLTLMTIESKVLSTNLLLESRAVTMGFEEFEVPEYVFPKQTIILEEPEAHLHPRLQSMLCDILLDAYKKYNIHFVVETHSEYIIRKSQILVKRMDFKTNDQSEKESPFRTYYFPVGEKPYSLGYRKDGKFVEKFGKGFYDEASDLIFEIL